MRNIAIAVAIVAIFYWYATKNPVPKTGPEDTTIEMVDGRQHIGHGVIFFVMCPDSIIDRGFYKAGVFGYHDGPYIVQQEKDDTMLYLYFPGGTGLQARIRRPDSVIKVEQADRGDK